MLHGSIKKMFLKLILVLLALLVAACCSKRIHHRKGNVTEGNRREVTRLNAVRRARLTKQDAVTSLDNFKTVGLTEVVSTINVMHQAGYNRKGAAAEKKSALDGKVDDVKNKVNEVEGEDRITTVTQAISGVVSGIPVIIQGYKDGDWKGMLSGALTVAAGISSMFGPVGSVISTILSLVSSIFSLFGGSSNEPTESQEDVMKRVVETAIKESQIKELKEEIAGVKNLYTSLADSLRHFREIAESQGKPIPVEQASQFYNHAFQELVPFGKLKEAIKEYCPAGVIGRKYKEADSTKNDKKVRNNAKTCLAFLRLYCELAVQRQFLLTDMAAVLNDDSKQALKETALNFVYMINKEQERDKDLLQFLVDPINHHEHRYSIVQFYDHPEESRLVIAYLETLQQKFPDFAKQSVVICESEGLTGRCVAMGQGAYTPSTTAGSKKIRASAYVPNGMKLEIELAGAKKGPFAGAYVYSCLPEFKKFTVSTTPEDIAKKVDICTKVTDDYRCCQRIGVAPLMHDVSDVDGVDLSGESLKAISIPNKFKVTIYDSENKVVGPLYGPDTIKDACMPTNYKWDKIEVKDLLEDKKLGRDIKDKFVKVCEEANLQGKCYRVPMPSNDNLFVDLTVFTAIGKCAFPVKSFQVPKAVEVTAFTTKSDTFANGMGPYLGPASVLALDTELYTNWAIRFLKIVDMMVPAVELCQKKWLEEKCIRYPVLPTETTYDVALDGVLSLRLPAGAEGYLITEHNMRRVSGPRVYNEFNTEERILKVKTMKTE